MKSGLDLFYLLIESVLVFENKIYCQLMSIFVVDLCINTNTMKEATVNSMLISLQSDGHIVYSSFTFTIMNSFVLYLPINEAL